MHDFHFVLAAYVFSQMLHNFVSAHNEDALNLVFLFSTYGNHIIDVVRRGCHINNVVRHNLVVTARNDNLAVTLDCVDVHEV